MNQVFRFAPSPTGLLHVGNARVALINWLFSESVGGSFVLRIDDTDSERSTSEFESAIRRDLEWLGLEWSSVIHQSARFDLYERAAESLKESGHLYACYETPEELELKRRLLLSRGHPPTYDQEGLRLTEAQKEKFESKGRKPYWRFRLEPENIEWDDLVRGQCHYNGAHISDPVLIRADGSYLYQLPSVVDDIDLGVTHIVRGEDHVTNTAAQLQIMRALSGSTVQFLAHLPLLTDASGKGLSKRIGSISLADLQEDGFEPLAIASLLAKLGSAEAIEAQVSMDALVKDFKISRFSRGSPKFDADELGFVNAKVLHLTSYWQISERLGKLGVERQALDLRGEEFWEAVKPNLKKFNEALSWWYVCSGATQPVIEDEDKAFLAEAATVLPEEPWDSETWVHWTAALKARTGRKGKFLYLPVRRALTGLSDGPELKYLLPLIGRERAEQRLVGVTA